MSRKASSASEYFIPFEGIQERVFDHKFEDYFGSKATFSKATAGDGTQGWLVRKCTRNPKDPVRQLQSDTKLVENALREQQERLLEQQSREQRSARTYPDLSNYGGTDTPGTQLPIRADTQRNHNETLLQERVAGRPVAAMDNYQAYPKRHSSIIDRHGDTNRTSLPSSQYGVAATNPPTVYVLPRRDGHSPRSSSRMLSSSPRDVPQGPGRHNTSQDLVRDRLDTLTELPTPVSRSSARERHTGQVSYGNTNAQTAALDRSGHVYVQNDFPDFFEWSKYNREREDYEAQTRHISNSRRSDSSAEESTSEEYADNEKPTPRHSQKDARRLLRQGVTATHRHNDTYQQDNIGNTKNPALARHKTATAIQSRDARRPEVPIVDEANDSDDVIGHRSWVPSDTKPSKGSVPEVDTVSRKSVAVKLEPKNRHGGQVQLERRTTASEEAPLAKSTSRDQGKSTDKSTSKSTFRHHRGSTSRKSKPAVTRETSYRGDGRSSSSDDESSEDVTIRSNSKRRRDPGYKARHHFA